MMKHRLGIIIPFTLFGLFFVLYTIVWNKGASIMKREIAAFAADQDVQGHSFSYDRLKVAGYPLSLRGTLANASWTDNQGYGFSSEKLQVITLPYDVSRILFAPQGERVLTLRGEEFELESDALLFSLEEGFAAAEGQNFNLTGATRTITFSNLIANRQELAEGDSIAVDLRDLDFGGDLSIRIPIFQLSAGLIDDRLNIGAMQFSVGRERDEAFTDFLVSGTLTADDAGLLTGDLDITFKNERAALMLLADLGFLSQGASSFVAAGLGLVTDGGTKETSLELILDEGNVALGGLPVGRIPLGEIPPLTN